MFIVMGNGESRLSVSYDSLKSHVTYGCNALYRDFNPTALIATDEWMIYEIMLSNYSKNNQCYFDNFDLLPAESVDFIKQQIPKNVKVVENNNKNYMFSLYGRELDKDLNKNPCYYIIWIDSDDMVTDISDIIPERYDERYVKDSGINAIEMCCAIEKPEHIFLLGFDLSNHNGNVNNVYKGTNCYADSTSPPVDPTSWFRDLNAVLDKYKHIGFTHVQNNKVLDIDTITVKDFINML